MNLTATLSQLPTAQTCVSVGWLVPAGALHVVALLCYLAGRD